MTETEFKQETATARPKLVSIALRYLKNSDEAEDIVQDAMLRLWQIHAELNLPLMPIASVITRNIAIDRLRHAMPHTAISSLQAIQPEERTETDERIDRMLHIMNTLPTFQQTILHLRHIDGMEYAGIAQITGSTEAAIRQAVSRARRAVLKQYNNGK